MGGPRSHAEAESTREVVHLRTKREGVVVDVRFRRFKREIRLLSRIVHLKLLDRAVRCRRVHILKPAYSVDRVTVDLAKLGELVAASSCMIVAP